MGYFAGDSHRGPYILPAGQLPDAYNVSGLEDDIRTTVAIKRLIKLNHAMAELGFLSTLDNHTW